MSQRILFLCLLMAVLINGQLSKIPIRSNRTKVLDAPSSRIVGGFPASELNLPYIASLQRYGYHSCGGSIVNELTVLTAAHCLASATPRTSKVKVGGKTRAASDGQLYAVKELHYHDKWNSKTMDYDIGLVRLAKPIVYSRTVRPIPVARVAATAGTYATIAGWGFTSANGPGSDVLRYARVPIIDQTACRRIFGSGVTDRMVCAGFLRGGVDACQMDSGGPLVVRGKLQGIVSWGISCALANKPGVYTRLEALLPWIDELMNRMYNELL